MYFGDPVLKLGVEFIGDICRHQQLQWSSLFLFKKKIKIYIFQVKCNPGYFHRTPHSLSLVLTKYNTNPKLCSVFHCCHREHVQGLGSRTYSLNLKVFLVFPSLSGLFYVLSSFGLVFESQSWYLFHVICFRWSNQFFWCSFKSSAVLSVFSLFLW